MLYLKPSMFRLDSQVWVYRINTWYGFPHSHHYSLFSVFSSASQRLVILMWWGTDSKLVHLQKWFSGCLSFFFFGDYCISLRVVISGFWNRPSGNPVAHLNLSRQATQRAWWNVSRPDHGMCKWQMYEMYVKDIESYICISKYIDVYTYLYSYTYIQIG